MNRKALILLLLVFLSGTCRIYSQTSQGDTLYMRYFLETLANDSMGGRKPGTEYDLMAAGFIAGQFRSARISPLQMQGYFQEFSYTSDSSTVSSRNVVAFIDNKAGRTIIIGAHYDHIGFGGKRSRSFGKHEVHNGADDNASGVALLLDLARSLKKAGIKKYNFIFVAFAGHEEGLFGSAFFASCSLVDLSSVRLMINLDMVGRADPNEPTLFFSTNDTLVSAHLRSLQPSGQYLRLKQREMSPGDHSAFLSKQVPVLFFTTGMHDDYHKTSDDAGCINYPGLFYTEGAILEILGEF